MARVTGVGGVFLKSADPKRLTEWYAHHLGLPAQEWGTIFFWKDEVPPGSGMTVWSAFPEGADKFEGPQQVAINYRVDDLGTLLDQLRAAGVWIDPKQHDDSTGRFAWIRDCDGNRIELWQPLAD